MKVVILAGGYGLRFTEMTKKIPKPMIKIYGKPIIEQIIKIYSLYNYKDFIIATGYKSSIIKKYFERYKKENSFYIISNTKVRIRFIFTGLNTMTGGRLKKLEKYFNKKDCEEFMLTYGDGISNVNLSKAYKFYKKHKKTALVTAVRPTSRYGVIKIKNNLAVSFEEKKTITTSWINGGFFIFNTNIFKFIKNSMTVLEEQPMKNLSKQKKLLVYKHKDFWHSFDTKRDIDAIKKTFSRKQFKKSYSLY